MKQLITAIIFLLVILTSCNRDDEVPVLTGEGTILDFSGTGNCNIVIDMDNGTQLQPLFYPSGFLFTSGQRLHIQYQILENNISSCEKGQACEILYLEELSCKSFITFNGDSVSAPVGDLFFLRDALIDGNCLQAKVSFSGGCRNHYFDLVRIKSETNDTISAPVFVINHNANNDPCEAFLTRYLRFDISPIISEGYKQFILKVPLANGNSKSLTFDISDT
ncbi:MAG: hypothetical protein CSA36_07445 [Draconibacterium sp.]|nr:MAG: hypothetical protein CSA36_07445 [Draconibacterium sp.]